MSEKLLCGKNAIVTGCARGIGKEILERFAYHGANLWACARNLTPEFDEYCKFLAQSYGVIVTPLCFDMRNLDEMRAAVKLLMKSELNVNGLVNNAGISLNALYQMTSERDLRE